MQNEGGIILVADEHDLQQPTAKPASPDDPLVVLNPARKRSSNTCDHVFGLVRANAMLGQMFDVPVVPPEVHNFLCNKIGRLSILIGRAAL